MPRMRERRKTDTPAAPPLRWEQRRLSPVADTEIGFSALLSNRPLSACMDFESRRLLDHARTSFTRLAQRRLMFIGGALIAMIYLNGVVAAVGFTLCYALDFIEMKVCAATMKARDSLHDDRDLQRVLMRRLHLTGSASTFAVVLFVVGSSLSAPEELRFIPLLFLVSATLYWAVYQHQIRSIVQSRTFIVGAGVLVILIGPLAASTPEVASPMWPKAMTAACVFYFIHVCARGYAARYDRALGQIASVSEALEESARSARHKSDLLRILSHELRTPLNGVMGMAELMRLAPLPTPQRGQLDTLRASAGRLEELIGQVMDSERLEAGRLRIVKAPVVLSSVIAPILERHRPSAVEKGLTLRLEMAPTTPAVLVIDGDRFGRCLDHLISNAIKFTEKGGVTVTCAHDVQPGPPVLSVEVRDTGIGMSAETMASVFERFSQDNMTEARSYGGLGLGLWISRVSAELMGGDLTVESVVGEGSAFKLTLIAEEAGAAPVSAPQVVRAG